MTRYSVVSEILDIKHPYHPNTVVWRIVDILTGYIPLTYYLNENTAWEMLKRKNEKITNSL